MMKKLLIMLAVFFLAAPTMAADWNFYGSVRMSTFYTDWDPDDGTEGDKDIYWRQQGNSRIGASVWVNDHISGGFEMGASDFNKRKLFGTYTFDNGSDLLIGQTYPPTSSYFYSNNVFFEDFNLLGAGQFYTSRQAMIQWSGAGFRLALVEPSTRANTADPTDVVLPKIEASYGFKADNWFVDIFGGYNSFDVEGATQDTDVTSYVLGLGGGVNIGGFFINLGGHWGLNLGNYGAIRLDILDTFKNVADDIDNEGFGGLAVIGYNISDRLTVEAGYGYVNYELDVDGADGDSMQWTYLNIVINIAPNFIIVPEVGRYKSDFETEADGSDFSGNVTYIGAKWQINF